ncbi:hypothetical protein DKG34_11080 [Streptomyces sp. NWU49]|uniref:hypothetical protein n=1 Tax=Streptomyces sp. NWU49 TaxID=2201153 RepID=UPI000D680A49|nr:hypothetical protein [Streptomyces sp. NWU49]PWJ07935.1 hypothetical protein DKG34_11080 [Streptomyces sp. NWU49]
MAVQHRQGVTYSAPRGDANVFVRVFDRGVFIYAWMVDLYFIARALWFTDDETGKAVPSMGIAPREPKAGA